MPNYAIISTSIFDTPRQAGCKQVYTIKNPLHETGGLKLHSQWHLKACQYVMLAAFNIPIAMEKKDSRVAAAISFSSICFTISFITNLRPENTVI